MITMNKKKILSLFILFVLFLGIIYKPFIIKADSGFDSSYDSSSSDDYNNSSSDSYISSSDDYYSGSSNGEYHSFSYESLILIIFIIIIAFICSPITNGINHIDRLFNNIIGYIFYLLFGNIKVRLVTITIIGIYILPKLITVPISFIAGLLSFIIIIVYNVRLLMKGSDFKKLPPKLTNEEIREKIPDLNIQEFNNQVFNIYKEIQIAWMNYNIDSIKNLVSNEIYNMYKMQLETLKVKEQKNIMLNIKYIDNYISNIITDNNTITIKTVLKVTCYDYIIDNKNSVVRGNKNKKCHYTYLLTFTKEKNKNISICPNCGAKININSSGICDFCKATIINNENDWIMVKKEMLRQK